MNIIISNNHSTSNNNNNNIKRKQRDMMKLIMNNYQVEMEDQMNECIVQFHGPKETPYENGIWKLKVTLPNDYPFNSPSIGFMNRIYHPNVDSASGSICLDVINQTWSPMFDLLNVFEAFIPQLLRYPNASDPLNSEAAALLLKDPIEYAKKVREYVLTYASKELLYDTSKCNEEEKKQNGYNNQERECNSDLSEMSEMSEMSDIED